MLTTIGHYEAKDHRYENAKNKSWCSDKHTSNGELVFRKRLLDGKVSTKADAQDDQAKQDCCAA